MTRKILGFLGAILLAARALAAVETTTISGTIYLPDGVTPATSGTLTASLSTAATTPDGSSTAVVASRVVANISPRHCSATTATLCSSDAGCPGGETCVNVSITLVPNDAMSPSGTYYSVAYNVKTPTSSSWNEKWSVTTSPDPVALGSVIRVDTPPGIVPPISIVQDEGVDLPRRTKLNFTGAGVTCVDTSGSARTDCTITTGGGGGTPGGSPGQLQGNNASSFDGVPGSSVNFATGAVSAKILDGARNALKYATGGDGLANATPFTGWEAAITAGAGVVMLRGGDDGSDRFYDFPDSGITVPSDVDIVADGHAIVTWGVNRASVNPGFIIPAGTSHVRIRGLRFEPGVTVPLSGMADGTGGASYIRIGTSGNATPATDIEILDNTFGIMRSSSADGSTISVAGSGARIIVRHNRFDRTGDAFNSPCGDATVQYTLDDVDFSQNVAWYSDTVATLGDVVQLSSGCILAPAVVGKLHRVNISDNLFYNVNGGIEVGLIGSGLTIDGNTMQSDYLDWCVFVWPEINTTRGIDGVSINGNTCMSDTTPFDGDRRLFNPRISAYLVRNGTISGNAIYGSQDGAGQIQAIDAENLAITGNAISVDLTASQALMSAGVDVRRGSGITVSGNSITNAANYGIFVNVGADVASAVNISGNVIRDTNATTALLTAIFIDGTCNGCSVNGNLTYTQSAPSSWLTVPASVTQYGNAGYVAGTLTSAPTFTGGAFTGTDFLSTATGSSPTSANNTRYSGDGIFSEGATQNLIEGTIKFPDWSSADSSYLFPDPHALNAGYLALVDSPSGAPTVTRGTAFPTSPAPVTGQLYVVTDDSAAGACDSAAGSATTLCQYNGASWVAIGGGGGGSGTVTHTLGPLTSNALVVGNGAADTDVLASLGTTTTLLHGNAAGRPTFSGVVSADVTDGTLVDADVSGSAAIAGSKIAAASGSVAGVVSTGAQTFAGTKTFNGGAVAAAGQTFAVTSGCTVGTNVTCPADATLGGGVTLYEGADDGLNFWTLKLPDSGITTDYTFTLNADGTVPVAALDPLVVKEADIGAGLVVSSGAVAFDYSATLAGSPAMNAGECRFDATDGTNQGGMICEGPTANTGEFFLQMGAAGAAGDRTTIVPMNTSTTAITLAAKDLAQTWSAVQTYSTTPIFQTGTTIGANADADLTLVTIDQGTGTDPTVGWLDTPTRLDFNGMNFQMDDVNTTAGVGTYWPITAPVSTAMYSGVGGFTFNGNQDNVICWAYNTDCSGTATNASEYAFNDVAEMSYDHDATAGRQSWIERNWNYKPVGVTQWRPFAFILDTDANSAHGSAKWYWTPNDLNSGANVVAALDWPYVAFNFQSGTDVYTDAGTSFWKRASSINPGGTEYGSKSVFYLDHTDDRSGPNQVGFYSLIEFNSTSSTAKAGNLYGGQTKARISGSTASRTVNSVTGWLLQTELASTNTGVSPTDAYGLRAEMNFSGQNVTVTNSAAGIYLPTPTAPGTSTSIPNFAGIKIANQGCNATGMSGGDCDALRIDSQSATDGQEGNLTFGGFGYNTGHVRWDGGGGAWHHLWGDDTKKVLRMKADSAPTSEADGRAIVMGSGATTWGPMLWAASGTSCTTACDNAGLTCQDAFPSAGGASVGCANTAAANNCACK